LDCLSGDLPDMGEALGYVIDKDLAIVDGNSHKSFIGRDSHSRDAS